MSFFEFVNHWWNLPFLVMLGLVAAFFVLQLLGLVGHHGDADADADHEVDTEGDHAVEAGGLQEVLSFFGIGRVPFMVVWGSLFICAGFTGIFVNRVLFVRLEGRYPGWLFPISLLVALIVGLVFTRVASRLASRLVDTGGRGSARKHDLVGMLGIVASAHVDERFGEVHVQDAAKNQMIVHAHVRVGERQLPRGAQVVLVEFDEARELFLIEPSDFEGKTGQHQ